MTAAPDFRRHPMRRARIVFPPRLIGASTSIACSASLVMLALSACTLGRPRSAPSPLMHQADDANAAPATWHGLPNANDLTEFEFRRLHAAAGQFITPDVLAAYGDLPLGDVLRSRLRGFGLPSDRMNRGLDAGCTMAIYVNRGRTADVIADLHPRDLAGVEYYEATSAPLQYRPTLSSCPVLLLWLKR